MPRITRRQSITAWNLSAPLDAELRAVPAERKRDPNAAKEWKIQAAAVKAIHERMRYDKSLWYEVNLIEGARTPQRANFARMMGMQRGPNDLTLYRQQYTHDVTIKTHRIEFKLPGNKLTPEQEAWFSFHRRGGVPCSRVDNLKDFLRILDAF